MVRRVAENVFIPFTVGGGIRTVDDMRAILREGADKISVNSAAILRPELISEGAEKFGSQCIVVAIDARRRHPESEDTSSNESNSTAESDAAGQTTTQGDIAFTAENKAAGQPTNKSDFIPGWNVYRSGGRIDTGLDAIEWAKKAEQLGAGEILLTSMDCDGTKSGYDLELTRAVADAVSIPVIASGGAGTSEHFYEALTTGGADAALAASLFHYKELEIREVKEYLAARGIPIRMQ